MRRMMSTAAALAALALTLGCGDSGGSGSSGSGPSQAQTETVQKSENGGGAASQTMSVANEALVDEGSGGAVAAKGAAKSGKSAGAFNFQANVNITIDLDDTDPSGADRWPNASGRLNIVASGSIAGDPYAGTAAYSVQTNWLTEGVFTDPVSGVVARMSVGSGFQYSLDVQWTYLNDLNWSITANSDISGNHTLTIVDGGVTYTATASGTGHADVSFTRTPASFSVVYSIRGTRNVTISDGLETHIVTVDIDGLDKITITVDGAVFGPYTAFQVRHIFGCVID